MNNICFYLRSEEWTWTWKNLFEFMEALVFYQTIVQMYDHVNLTKSLDYMFAKPRLTFFLQFHSSY